MFARGMGRVMVKSILITLAALVLFVIGATFAADIVAGLLDSSYSKYITWFVGAGSFVLAWILFPGVMPFIAGFFNTDVMDVIEKNEYSLLRGRTTTQMEDLGFDIKFTLKALVLNILVLPLYLIPVVNICLFLVLNGWLLGKQFFIAAARRHVDDAQAKALCEKAGREAFFGGVAIAFLATVPLVNLLIPFWGVAVMTHMFHRVSGRNA